MKLILFFAVNYKFLNINFISRDYIYIYQNSTKMIFKITNSLKTTLLTEQN